MAKRKVPIIKYKTDKDHLKGKASGDTLDQFLTMMDDPDDWRTLAHPTTGDKIKLTHEELDILRRIEMQQYADAAYDPYEPYVDFFTGTTMQTPLGAAPEPKRRFLPSKWEALKVAKIVRAIRKGWIKLEEETDERPDVYDIWSGETDDAISKFHARHIAAPKVALPGHRESYNPPAEYLLDEKEKAEWEAMDPEDRPFNYLPQKYSALRHVPAYERIVNERFGRCLDLFLCPRAIKDKIQMHPDDLLPKLPDPRDLRPFPTHKSLDFIGHTKDEPITALSINPTGQWMISAARDGQVRLWDVQTGHCRATWQYSEAVQSLAWNPNKSLFMFSLAVENRIEIIVPQDLPLTESTISMLKDLVKEGEDNETAVASAKIKWTRNKDSKTGILYSLEHSAPVADVQWHRRGDYFAALCPTAGSGAQMITIHQLSRRLSQHPFRKMPGILRALAFHPSQPHLVVATSKTVRIYDLVKREQVKKLIPGVQSISSLSIHPGGDNLIIGSHDPKLCWFDLDFSIRPYRSLLNHQAAIRSVAFHPILPLFASSGDDGIVQVIHGQVYADLSTNALIVPVKTLRDFEGGSSVSKVVFHPIQPWLITATSSGSISLFV